MGLAYKIADVIRAAGGKPPAKAAAIIVAAGSSTRMGGGISKQLMNVAGIPVLARTLLAFEKCEAIEQIVLVVRESDAAAIKALAAQYKITKLFATVKGGSTRALSVEAGVAALSGTHVRLIAIHDGARCLVTPKMIERVVRAAARYRAATAAYPVTDTVKQVNARGFIEKTIDRRTVWHATTPQVFDKTLYISAWRTGRKQELLTDDNQLLEQMPFPIKVVDCGRVNLKITEPSDIAFAEFILNQREGAE
ncbi:MAG: 2-C-methyl-D-erythritol 4-phosphate cytidylyltransferase [Clostridia bacterium]|nr:2-C-methyl-D-erythritol 4-phosphate cytidylyltransferase [Clostridia bacterium]